MTTDASELVAPGVEESSSTNAVAPGVEESSSTNAVAPGVEESSSTNAVAHGVEESSSTNAFLWPSAFVEAFDESLPALDASTLDDDVKRWVVENKKVLMRVVTWNMAANDPPPMEDVEVTLVPKNR